MGRANFLSISILGFLFSKAGFPRVEREQWPEQSKQRGGILPPRRVILKSASERPRRWELSHRPYPA